MTIPTPRSTEERLLIVEDDDDLRGLLKLAMEAHGFEVMGAQTAEVALALLENESFEVILADHSLPGMTGIELCARLAAESEDRAIVIMTGYASTTSAVEAMRAGAWDYVVKPFDVDAVVMRLVRLFETLRIRAEAKRLRQAVTVARSFGGLLGSSPAMRSVYDLLERSARAEASVLITGESGTGKELAARALHEQGPRKDGPFVALNCSAVPAALLESELFGHAKGAFTDARSDRQGLFVQASGGTLFLDELGEIPLALQPKLLRALEERRVRPIGASEEIEIDVRIVAATNRDLEAMIDEGRFRDDLYFRINVIQIQLPPLQARGTDVLVLAQQFIRRFAAQEGKAVDGLSPLAAQRLVDYDWPGNVRELRNCIERAVALTLNREIALEDLPERVRTYKRSHVLVAADNPTELVPLDEVERRYILRVLDAVGGSKTTAAKILGLDRKTLYRKLERYKARDGGA